MPYLRGMAYVFLLKVIPEAYIRVVWNEIIFKKERIYTGPEHKTSSYGLAPVADGHGSYYRTPGCRGITDIINPGRKISSSRTQFEVPAIFSQ